MIVRIAELEIDPDRVGAYAALLTEEIEAAVRLEPGVVFLFAVAVKGSPNRVRVIEGYADQAAMKPTSPRRTSSNTRRRPRIW